MRQYILYSFFFWSYFFRYKNKPNSFMTFIIDYGECWLHVRGYAVHRDILLGKECARQQQYVRCVVDVLVMATRARKSNVPVEVLFYIVDLAQEACKWHFLLTGVQGRSVSPQYLLKLARHLRIEQTIRIPSRHLYGCFSPRCYYKNETAYRHQYISWYQMQFDVYKNVLNQFLKHMTKLGWVFNNFPAYETAQKLTWKTEAVQDYRFIPKMPYGKPSGHGPKLTSSQIWWEPQSLNSRYGRIKYNFTYQSEDRILRSGRVGQS